MDASAVCEPYLSLIQFYQLGKIINFEGCKEDYLTGIVAENQWVSKHEDLVTAYLKAHLRAHQLMRNNSLQISRIISQYTEVPTRVAFQVLSKIRWDAAIYTRDLETLSNIGLFNGPSFYESANKLRATNLQRDCVNEEYLITAVKQLKLPSMTSSMLQDNWTSHPIF